MKGPTVLLIGLVLMTTAGCTLVGPPESIQFIGNTSITSDDFKLEGEIMNSSPGDPPEFENVTIQLYTESGDIIDSVNVGTLTRSRKVSISTDQIPKYVILTSPEFWEHNHIDVSYYVLDPEEDYYVPYSVGSRSELPVDVE